MFSKIWNRKKKVIIIIIILLILFFPIPKGTLDDGSRVYAALTYKLIKWTYIKDDKSIGWNKAAIYWFPKNYKNINELRKIYINARNKE